MYIRIKFTAEACILTAGFTERFSLKNWLARHHLTQLRETYNRLLLNCGVTFKPERFWGTSRVTGSERWI